MAEYRGGATPGGKIGCGVAACVGLPLTGAVCIAAALGDCAPGVVCRRDVDWALLAGTLLTPSRDTPCLQGTEKGPVAQCGRAFPVD